jgi:hypothetical protein
MGCGSPYVNEQAYGTDKYEASSADGHLYQSVLCEETNDSKIGRVDTSGKKV